MDFCGVQGEGFPGQDQHQEGEKAAEGIQAGGSHNRATGGQKEMKRVTLYTDGACSGNPGPGGYGTILKYGPHKRELSGGYRRTTNNRMELKACIAGLQALKYPCSVIVFSDSKYLVDACRQGWARRWRANGWKRNKRDHAENTDLWEELLRLCEKHQVSFKWVKGHSGHPENERCDQLATAAAQKDNLMIDTEFEKDALPG